MLEVNTRRASSRVERMEDLAEALAFARLHLAAADHTWEVTPGGLPPGRPVTDTSAPRGRRPGPTETREKILAEARDLFAEKGYDGASLRAIARAAGVDPALVHHFFGNKEGVFIEAMRFPVDPSVVLPRIMGAPRDRLGEALVRTFLDVWGTRTAAPPCSRCSARR